MVLVPIVDVFYVCVVFSWFCAIGVLIAREMLAFDDEVVLGAIHPSPLRNILGLGATPLESTLLTLMLSCVVDKAYSFDEVVRVEVVLWRLWVWVVLWRTEVGMSRVMLQGVLGHGYGFERVLVVMVRGCAAEERVVVAVVMVSSLSRSSASSLDTNGLRC